MQINLEHFEADPNAVIATGKVSNVFPERSNGVALIGDYPLSKDARVPFDGSHGGTLVSLMKSAGINYHECFHGNVINYHPGRFTRRRFDWKDPRAVDSIKQLEADLTAFNPRYIIGFGDLALDYLKGDAGQYDDERGSPFISPSTKKLTVITYHPRQIFVQYKLAAIAGMDLAKVAGYIKTGFSLDQLPQLKVSFAIPFTEIMARLDWMLREKPYLVCDIETLFKTKRMTCVGLAWSPTEALVIPLLKMGKPAWSLQDEASIMRKLAQVLETCPLAGHNAVHFDHQVLAQWYNIRANFVDDTMFAHWSCYPEMPKSLAFVSSLHTNNPYWKQDLRAARSGKIPYTQEFLYCGRDVCYNFEVLPEIKKEFNSLPAPVVDHYKFNIRVSRCFQYASIRGVQLNKSKKAQRQLELEAEVSVLEEKLHSQVGYKLNVNSPKQMLKFLYEDLRLPVKYKRVKNQDGETEDRETGDFLSLLYLAKEFPDITELQLASEVRKRKKRLSWLTNLQSDKNGRIYWGFNNVGTETGRGSGYKPLNGFGCQPQNVPRTDRDLIEAGVNPLGEPCYWLKADLEGADSWTQAVQLYVTTGEATLWDDLKAGLKPAFVITIAEHFGEHLLTASHSELLELVGPTKKIIAEEKRRLGEGQTSYDINKVVSHGSAYMMQAPMMHVNIFKRSMGELYIPVRECERRQQMIFARYPFPKLHQAMRAQLNTRGYLDCASGSRRVFFGRKDNSTLRQMLAHAPQAHTTYTANVVLERWYYNEAYRIPGTRIPIIEPINQVHDETDGAISVSRIEEARRIFHESKNVELDFWGEKFTIPFEAQYGDSWGSAGKEM